MPKVLLNSLSYGAAVVVVFTAALFRQLVDPWLGENLPFVTFYGAVALIAWIGSYRPAIVAAVLGYLATDYLFLHPRGTVIFGGFKYLIDSGAYVIICSLLIGFAEAAHSARRRAAIREVAASHVLGSITDGIVTIDHSWRYLYVNAEAERLLKRPRHEFIGKTLWELYPEVVGTETARYIRRAIVEQQACEFEGYSQSTGRWYLNKAYPTSDGGVTIYFRDTTARKVFEGQLGRVLASINDHLVCYDRVWRFTYVNDGAAELFGTTREQLLGKCVWDLYPEQVGSPLYLALHEAFNQQKVSRVEHFDPKRDAWYEYHLYPSAEGMTVFASDVTARRRAEEAVRSGETRLKLALSAAQAAAWEWDVITDQFGSSPEYYSLHGLNADEVFDHRNWLQLVHEDDRNRVREEIMYSMASTPDVGVDFRIIHPQKGLRWLTLIGSNLRDADGKLLRMVGVTMDITDRKQSEETLRTNEERLRLALEAGNMGIWEWNMETNEAHWSDSLLALHGLQTGQTENTFHAFYSLIHPDDQPKVLQMLHQSIDERTDFDLEFRTRHANGGILWLLAKGKVLMNSWDRPWRMVGVGMDITAQKQLEEELQLRVRELAETEAHVSLALSVGQIGTWQWDPVIDVVTADERCRAMYGLEAAKTGDRASVLARIHPLDRDAVQAALQKALLGSGDGQYAAECRFVHPDGQVRWVVTRGQTMFEGRGKSRIPVRLIGTAVDITDRKIAEETLRESEEKLQAIIDSVQALVYAKDREQRFLLVNRYCEQVLGTEHNEILGHTDYDYFPAEIADAFVENDLLVWKSQHAQTFEEVQPRADGLRTYISLKFPLRKPNGEMYAVCGVSTDITERKHMEVALRESEATLKAYYESSPAFMGIAELHDHDLLHVYDNPATCRFLGVLPGETSGRWTSSLGVPPELIERWIEHYRQTAQLGRPVEYEFAFPLSSQETRWFAVTVAQLPWSPSAFPRFCYVAIDITANKAAEQALKEADRRKDEFLATLAHELRNPLSPIRNASQILMAEGAQTEDFQWICEVIDRQVQHMGRLLDDLLDVSRITRGKLELRKGTVDLATVLRAAVETSRPLIKQGQHVLHLQLPDEPVVLEADPVRLAQVFSNLLNNAAKYMDAGGSIELKAQRQANEVFVSVKDTGIGIAPEVLPTIFDIFSQATSALERSQGGLGIGLSLVRGVVELHGGSIEVHSDGIGKGTEFLVRLPLSTTVERESGDVHGEFRHLSPTRSLRILVADDNYDSANSLAVLLAHWGHQVEVAYDGQDAIEQALEFYPEVIILDIGMPRLNGYEAARQIREEMAGRDPMLIALTGWGQEEDRRRTAAAGFHHHLVKPVDHATLNWLLAEAARRTIDAAAP